MPYPRAGRDVMCPHCHDAVHAFSVPYLDWPVYVEDRDLPITADLNALVYAFAGLVWEWAGPNVGWIEKYTDQRTWRPLRARHVCTNNEGERTA